MNQTFLIARDRKSGKDVLLAVSDVPYREQIALYREFNEQTHERYSSVVLLGFNPIKKPLRFLTGAELKARQDQHDAQVAEEARQQAEAAKKAKAKGGKKSKGKPKAAEEPSTTEPEAEQPEEGGPISE